MFHLRFVLPLMLALLVPALSFAKDQKRSIVDPADKQQFADQAAAIRDAMKPGGRFQYLTVEERKAVNEHFDAIAAMLERRETERFGSDEQLDLLQAQENANAILTRRDGDRLICERRAPTGSNFKIKKCVTYTEHMKSRDETQQTFSDQIRRTPADFCNIPGKC
ncbi:hypothetical protein [Tahibacter sp.]|uniref:hypothetical protein n=1 Tax=Tahibacter sp. TaxID=2056211 RepID=UPI0028C404E7|nr:hypothetical protein [Tahibacter sp.]